MVASQSQPQVSVRSLQGGELMRASHQWSTRPDDERYLTLEALHAAVAARRQQSREVVYDLAKLADGIKYDDSGELFVNGKLGRALFTNYSFGQLATEAHAPAGYLRKLPAPLAAINLQYGLANSEDSSKLLVIPSDGGQDGRFMAVTSPTYGRIWDQQIVEQVQRVNHDGRWVVPSASYSAADPRRATTLYASDHDVFLFLVDPSRPVDVAGEQLFRGFMAWNSETGDKTFGLMTFLYRYVCDNRIIWGASEVRELIIRHTRYGPDRFAQQAAPALRAYAEGSTKRLEAQIIEAKSKHVGKDAKEVAKWLTDRGFGQEVAKVSVFLAEREEGDPTSLWNVVQGVTAYARGIVHTDSRVDLERKAGALIDL